MLSVSGAQPPAMFPSPQGGSETLSYFSPYKTCALFPSPQGGSETRPSMREWRVTGNGFHPLKAGRRLRVFCTFYLKEPRFPSPQGGSETGMIVLHSRCDNPRFHPLKAGRRP